MKITILVDNNTFIDQYFYGEPAVSFYIEADGQKILFDTGYSEIILANARKMGIDLRQVTHVVLSHGHNDHTNGLKVLQESVGLENRKLIAHPDCLAPKYYNQKFAEENKECHEYGMQDITAQEYAGEYIGAPYSEAEMQELADYIPCRDTYHITDKLIFLGEIPRTNQFENQNPIGKCGKDGLLRDDYLMDDTALVYQTKKGIFVITGCSHSGICNIIAYAKEVCREERIIGVLGGFHLFEDDEQLQKTIEYLQSCNIQKLYPCHCVSLLARAKMMEKLPVVETGVGMVLAVD